MNGKKYAQWHQDTELMDESENMVCVQEELERAAAEIEEQIAALVEAQVVTHEVLQLEFSI
jgi:hypothetical protein